MFVLGISGGIGSGKSSVADILRAHGLEVLDADKISHEVTKAGGSALSDIIDIFGPEFIDENGALDRAKMADIVFKDSKSLDLLSLIVHRKVFSEMDYKRRLLKEAKVKAVAMDVPVPAKEGFLDKCDQVWIVSSDDELRIERLEKRGIHRDDAIRRISIQLSQEEYASLGDIVIENNGDIRSLETKVIELIKSELISRGIDLSLDYDYCNSLERENTENLNEIDNSNNLDD